MCGERSPSEAPSSSPGENASPTAAPSSQPTCSFERLDRIDLGTAANFAILSKTGVTTTPGSYIDGHMGTSPIAETAITGFGLVRDSTNTF